MSELKKLHLKNHGGHYKEQMNGRWGMEISLLTNFNTSLNCTSQLSAQDHSHTRVSLSQRKKKCVNCYYWIRYGKHVQGPAFQRASLGFHLQIKMCIATGWLTVVSAWRKIKADWSKTQRRTRQSKEMIGQLCQRSARVHPMCVFRLGNSKTLVCDFSLHLHRLVL